MFKGQYLRWKRDRSIQMMDKKIKSARKAGDFERVKVLVKGQKDLMAIEGIPIEVYESGRITDLADKLDVELPDEHEPDVWILPPSIGTVLTTKGRALVRQRIYEEQTRRFELRVKWLKILAPVIAALAGLVGTITGLIAVLKK
jgi:hypothetical protein